MPALRTYIVEDSALIRDSLVAALQELADIEVVGTAESEGVAVRWLAQPGNLADLVIVDLFLQEGSGLGVLRALRDSATPRRARVVLSNYATPDMRRRCLELGADQVFDKSNDIDALIRYCAALAAGDAGPGARQPAH